MACTYAYDPGYTLLEAHPGTLSEQRISYFGTIDVVHDGLGGRRTTLEQCFTHV